jgi:hypothetical protein
MIVNILVMRDPKPFRGSWAWGASQPFLGMFYLPRGRAWTRKAAYRKAWKAARKQLPIPESEKIKVTLNYADGWPNERGQ